MKDALEGRPASHRWGSLIFDEISIKKDISFDKATMEHHGIVDFGDGMDTSKETDIADHVLVFMFRPYKWVQPFACFASKGAASGTVLFELITKAIVTLFNHCAIVKGVVSDGAQTNKKLIAYLGLTELVKTQENVKNTSSNTL